ncbi:hypothetical protein D3C71_2009050 [compost metagenome]
MVLAVGQSQLDIFGQKVTNTAAEQVAFVVCIATSRVREVAINKALHFNRALALSQSTKRSRRQHRTNDNA